MFFPFLYGIAAETPDEHSAVLDALGGAAQYTTHILRMICMYVCMQIRTYVRLLIFDEAENPRMENMDPWIPWLQNTLTSNRYVWLTAVGFFLCKGSGNPRLY